MSSVWLSDQDDVYLNSFCFGYRQDSTFDPHYLAYMLRSSSIRSDLTLLAQGISRFNISKNKVMELSVPVPPAAEQKQIGQYFARLDSLITLHQRKCQYRGLYEYLSWEQRKLGGLFFESNERSSSMEILSVSVAKGIYPASESDRDTNPGASLANYKVVRKGDVVYNSMRMWQGAVGSSDYDGIVSPAYVVARPVIELDSTCFGYLLKRPEMLYKYLCDSQGNSKDTQTLKYNRFADIEVTMPVNLEEQRVISACLGRVDTLITLHQRKRQYRSLYGYLSWEQRKLGEVASIKTGPFGSLLHAEDYVVDGIPIVTTEHFKSGFLPDEIAGLPQVSESDRARLEQYSAIEGDILFSRVGSVDVNAQVTAAQSGWLFSGRVLRARPTVSVISPNYLHYELSTDDVKRSIINRAVGGTMASINTEILEDTEISFPRSRTEQLEIGRSLGNLDSLIALHQ